MKEHLKWIDISKGVCLFFVLISHRCGIPFVGRLVGAFYMPLFFIASGYTSKPIGGDRCALAKKSKIIYKYFFYNAILIICWIVFSTCSEGKVSNLWLKIGSIFYSRSYIYPTDYAGQLSLLDMHEVCNGPLWFLTAYFCSWVLYYFSEYIREKLNVDKKLILTLLGFIAVVLDAVPILLPWSIDIAPVGAIFIYAGGFLKEKESDKIKSLYYMIGIIIFVVIAELNGITNFATRLYGNYRFISVVLFITTGILGTSLMFKACQLLERFKAFNIFAVAGRNTLPILAFHLLAFKCIDSVWNFPSGQGLRTYVYGLAESIIVFLLIILCCVGLNSIKELSSRK